MLGFLAAALAAPTPSPIPESPTVEPPAAESMIADSPVLESGMPWWERITVTVDDKGKQQACRYETSVSANGAEACAAEMAASVKAGGASGGSGAFSKVTFERRFSPGGRLDSGRLQPGDTLLGRQVMFLTFDVKGLIDSCKIVAVSGEVRPDYGCKDVRKEQFRAQASADPAARQAFMTVLAYGHTERIA